MIRDELASPSAAERARRKAPGLGESEAELGVARALRPSRRRPNSPASSRSSACCRRGSRAVSGSIVRATPRSRQRGRLPATASTRATSARSAPPRGGRRLCSSSSSRRRFAPVILSGARAASTISSRSRRSPRSSRSCSFSRESSPSAEVQHAVRRADYNWAMYDALTGHYAGVPGLRGDTGAALVLPAAGATRRRSRIRPSTTSSSPAAGGEHRALVGHDELTGRRSAWAPAASSTL